ncbi:hypothetical protein J2X17_002586 [Flavobacterium aquidurense]|nr:hypothetical protein [Flavobacterium aquidurense]
MLFPFFVSLVGLFFLLINSILFYRARKNKSIQYSIITIYLICLFVEELLCNITGFYRPGSNFFLSHYYFIFQFIALSAFFRQVFSNIALKRIVLFFLILVLILLAIQYYRKPDLYWEFNLFEIGVTSGLLISYGLIFLIQNLKKNKSNYLYFTNGLVMYLTSSLSIFLTGNTDSVIFTEPFLLDFWFFNSLFYIVYQFLIFKEWKVLTVKNRLRIPQE